MTMIPLRNHIKWLRKRLNPIEKTMSFWPRNEKGTTMSSKTVRCIYYGRPASTPTFRATTDRATTTVCAAMCMTKKSSAFTPTTRGTWPSSARRRHWRLRRARSVPSRRKWWWRRQPSTMTITIVAQITRLANAWWICRENGAPRIFGLFSANK